MWKEEAISYCEGTTFEKIKLKKLQSRARATDPTIWVGKEGATENLIKQVENQLRARELVKLKLQKSALAKSETIKVAEGITASTSSILVDVIGHTFTLYKKHHLTKSTLKSRVTRSSAVN
jgi:RNA-binding protein